jgi:hypothetical protein
MSRLALSLICGLTITVALTMVVISGVTSRNTSRVLLWQCMILAQGMPRGNIGTPEHPIYEGTPLDFIPVFIGIPLGVPIYASLTYAVLWSVAKLQRHKAGK